MSTMSQNCVKKQRFKNVIVKYVKDFVLKSVIIANNAQKVFKVAIIVGSPPIIANSFTPGCAVY